MDLKDDSSPKESLEDSSVSEPSSPEHSPPTMNITTAESSSLSPRNPNAPNNPGSSAEDAPNDGGTAPPPGALVSMLGEQGTHELQPGNNTLHIINSQDTNARYVSHELLALRLVSLAAIREQPGAPTQGHTASPTPPNSPYSSLKIEVEYDDAPGPSTHIDTPIYEPLVPWNAEEDLLGVGYGLQVEADQTPQGGHPLHQTMWCPPSIL